MRPTVLVTWSQACRLPTSFKWTALYPNQRQERMPDAAYHKTVYYVCSGMACLRCRIVKLACHDTLMRPYGAPANYADVELAVFFLNELPSIMLPARARICPCMAESVSELNFRD
jgi:hypothetical protein